MKKIYISGAISGLDPEMVKETFSKAEVHLQAKGWETVCPLDNGLPIESTWSQHMGKDVEMLLDCHAIAMLPGYEKSKGAKVELAIARHLNLEIYWLESLL